MTGKVDKSFISSFNSKIELINICKRYKVINILIYD